MELVRSSVSIASGLPCVTVRSAPAIIFRGLLSVHSRYGLHARGVAMRPFTPKSSDSFVASAAASIATGWSEPVPGRELHPPEVQRLFTAHCFKRGDPWRGHRRY
jgi:hypothetical protein